MRNALGAGGREFESHHPDIEIKRFIENCTLRSFIYLTHNLRHYPYLFCFLTEYFGQSGSSSNLGKNSQHPNVNKYLNISIITC